MNEHATVDDAQVHSSHESIRQIERALVSLANTYVDHAYGLMGDRYGDPYAVHRAIAEAKSARGKASRLMKGRF